MLLLEVIEKLGEADVNLYLSGKESLKFMVVTSNGFNLLQKLQ
jgi:hypothetical protein